MPSSTSPTPETNDVRSAREYSMVAEQGTVESTVPETVSAESATCPRCNANLIDPSGLGWCRACGYCRSLEEERAKPPLHAATAAAGKSSALGVVEFARLAARMPGWARILLTGVGVTILLSVPPMFSLPEASLSRCLWTTGQVIIGVLMILAAQFWAVMVIADSDDRLGAKDVIISGRLWVLACARLPETRRQVWLAAWGLTAILSALFLIGGLSYWFNYLPGR